MSCDCASRGYDACYLCVPIGFQDDMLVIFQGTGVRPEKVNFYEPKRPACGNISMIFVRHCRLLLRVDMKPLSTVSWTSFAICGQWNSLHIESYISRRPGLLADSGLWSIRNVASWLPLLLSPASRHWLMPMDVESVHVNCVFGLLIIDWRSSQLTKSVIGLLS